MQESLSQFFLVFFHLPPPPALESPSVLQLAIE